MKKKIIVCVGVVIVIASTIFLVQYYKKQKILHELESLENGYRLFTLEGYKKNFINLELKYVGQAKVSTEKKSEFEVYTMKEGPRFDGETLYAIDGYLFFPDKMTFEIYKDIYFNLYDIDFDIGYEEGKEYVMSIGRELKWLQFNPDWISQFGTVANRAGFEWNEEVVPYTVYVYEFSYDYKKYGNLGEMTIEF